jgi:hypothetical protein
MTKERLLRRKGLLPKDRTASKRAVAEAGSVRGKENRRSLGFARDDKGKGNGCIKIGCRTEAFFKSNLDKFEVQPSPFDKLRAGSAGLNLQSMGSHADSKARTYQPGIRK